jgi:hypothetical protein
MKNTKLPENCCRDYIILNRKIINNNKQFDIFVIECKIKPKKLIKS